MAMILWLYHINFALALLLHSCTKILLKERLNHLEITGRLLTCRRKTQQVSQTPGVTSATKASAALDAFTSIFSAKVDGEVAELYVANTGTAWRSTCYYPVLP